MKKKFINIIYYVAIAVFVISLILLIFSVKDYFTNRKSYNDLCHDYGPTISSEPINEENSEISIENNVNFPSLEKINSHCVGWITIPNTNINYPIVKNDDNEYYLNHNFEKSENKGGAIFMDYRLKEDFSNFNTILYGHNMKDGSMFADVNKYKEEDFFKENPYLIIYLPGSCYKVDIVSIYVDKDSSEAYTLSFDDTKKSNFIKYIKDKSFFQSPIEPNNSDKILTLSTCSYEYEEARTILHGIIHKVP